MSSPRQREEYAKFLRDEALSPEKTPARGIQHGTGGNSAGRSVRSADHQNQHDSGPEVVIPNSETRKFGSQVAYTSTDQSVRAATERKSIAQREAVTPNTPTAAQASANIWAAQRAQWAADEKAKHDADIASGRLKIL